MSRNRSRGGQLLVGVDFRIPEINFLFNSHFVAGKSLAVPYLACFRSTLRGGFNCDYDEREAKLKAVIAKTKQSTDKSTPVKSTIQFHDHSQLKPPRGVLRKQAKYGTAKDLPATKSELKRKLISGILKSTPTNSCPPLLRFLEKKLPVLERRPRPL